MSEKHLPIMGGGYDRLVCDLDGTAWVRERTCHIVKTWSDSDFVKDWNYKCSECGRSIPVYERDPESGDVIRSANYCPNCGAKVEGEGR